MSPEGGDGTPISLHDYMAWANTVYYGGRDPLGLAGDFITAPEISQMFGELIGLWCSDLVTGAGCGERFAWVELGPGRGTLAADAGRVMRRAGLQPPVDLVETSPVLREKQRAAMPDAQWHADTTSLPDDRPLVIVANEFFDALPIRQFVRTAAGWRERMVAPDPRTGGRIWRICLDDADRADAVAPPFADAPIGAIVERNPAAEAIIADLARRLARQGGALLAIDYGYEGPLAGDTLQAMAGHAPADPFEEPGTRDLTAHVDFAMLAAIGRDHGVRISPCVPQGAFLGALGIDLRMRALATANPQRTAELVAARDRLVAPEAMGRLFKVLCLRHPEWPMPAGFAGAMTS